MSPESKFPTRIQLSDERLDRLTEDIQALFLDEFDRELSEFQARRLLDFMLVQLGAPVYNQAIQDARAFFQAKLDDLDGECYEPEPQL